MNEILKFTDRDEFRAWLNEHCLSGDGVWLLFGKTEEVKTITALQALEEALCFGWIDGQMKSIDDKTYKKYFSPRRAKSKWSDKNKTIVRDLEKRGLMTEFGREKIKEAKENGQWDAVDLMSLGEEHIAELCALLQAYERAFANFQAMPQSVKKTYARAYFSSVTDAGRKKRFEWLVDRLDKNLRPM